MNIQARITEFENLGYHLHLDSGRLKYKFHALIEPPREKVIPLLQTIKTNKKAVIEYLKPKNTPIPFEVLRDLYLNIFNSIGWQSGLMARPEVIQTEDMLNGVWLKTMAGQASFNDFKRTLAEWERVISGAING